jgi:sec-independent protein translocase protein TatB
MFDIGWGELVVIGVVALVAIGPKELPSVLRAVGQWTGKIRRMAAEFQGQFQEAMREAQMADVRQEIEKAADLGNINPLADVQRDLDKTMVEADAQLAHNTTPPSTTAAIETPLPPAPEVKIDVPLPEPPSPLTAEDFAPPKPPETKPAGGGS